MIMSRTLYIFKVIVAIFAFSASGCTFPRDINGKFPVFPAAARMDVFALDAIPERKLCSIEGQKNIEEFIAILSGRYPESWHRPAPVSFAPSYRILVGTTEILVLKLGIAIAATTGGSGTEVFVHDLKPGEAEELVRAACKSTKNTE